MTASCAPQASVRTATDTPSEFCLIAQPIYLSNQTIVALNQYGGAEIKADKRKIMEHNAVYESLCPASKP